MLSRQRNGITPRTPLLIPDSPACRTGWTTRQTAHRFLSGISGMANLSPTPCAGRARKGARPGCSRFLCCSSGSRLFAIFSASRMRHWSRQHRAARRARPGCRSGSPRRGLQPLRFLLRKLAANLQGRPWQHRFRVRLLNRQPSRRHNREPSRLHHRQQPGLPLNRQLNPL